MVEEVKAYKTSDGRLHGSHLDAAKHECKARLEKCLGNPGVATAVMNDARCVFEATMLLLLASGVVEETSHGWRFRPEAKPMEKADGSAD